MSNTFVNSQLVSLLDGGSSGTTVGTYPYTRSTSGAGAGAHLVSQTAVVPVGATDATTVVYRMIRVPTNAIIKSVKIALELDGGTATTFTGNLGLYWSDAPYGVDGTPMVDVAANTAVSDSFFAYHLAAAGIVTMTDETFQNAGGNSATDGFYVPSASFQPLWVALSCGGFQGFVTGTVTPKGPQSSNWGGTGAVSSSTNAFYQLSADPGGFLDICWRPSSINSLTGAMNFVVEAAYTLGG